MSLLWIYDKEINPQAGGTERVTDLVKSELERSGYLTAGFLIFPQDQLGPIRDERGQVVDSLYNHLKVRGVSTVINQIGYSQWLLQDFLRNGGARWRREGGKLITCLHFDPLMFPETLSDLIWGWRRKTAVQKIRRLGRIVLLPVARWRATRLLGESFRCLIDASDFFVILSERHRGPLLKMAGLSQSDDVRVIPNPNTFVASSSTRCISRKQKIVLVVSRLEETQKRVSFSLLAWRRVMALGIYGDWILRVVGDGAHAADYRVFVAQRDIPNIEFVGRTDPEPHYDLASIYLHTARREGWGLTITEAMQKGAVPIVMRSSAVFEDLIDDGTDGILVKDADVRRFASELAGLMDNNERRESMAVNALESSNRGNGAYIAAKWSELFGSSEIMSGEGAI